MSTMTITPAAWIPSDDSFGARLALVRQRFGWNMKEAALSCGVPQGSWREWELRDRAPRNLADVAQAISARTGVDTLWLMTGSRPGGGAPKPTSTDPVDSSSTVLGDKVSQIMRFQGLNPERMSEAMAESRERVVALLEGRETWRAADIASAARVLGVSADWLLRLDSNQQPSGYSLATAARKANRGEAHPNSWWIPQLVDAPSVLAA